MFEIIFSADDHPAFLFYYSFKGLLLFRMNEKKMHTIFANEHSYKLTCHIIVLELKLVAKSVTDKKQVMWNN